MDRALPASAGTSRRIGNRNVMEDHSQDTDETLARLEKFLTAFVTEVLGMEMNSP